jgi:uncharacterized protein (DUF1800 family)
MAATDLLTDSDADHLLRRAAFGPRPGDVARLAGRTRASAVASLLGAKTRKKRPPAKTTDQDTLHRMQGWWLAQMRSAKWGAQEKLVLFWHDHFATSYRVANNLPWIAAQNGLFRQGCLGSFRDLAYRVTRDPAMLQYLDGFRNRAQSPNENYARELMELFVLGRADSRGDANYTQDDVRELARALTGFALATAPNGRESIAVNAGNFDAGAKTLFAGRPFEVTGNLGVETPDGTPFPPDRNVIDLLFTHRDGDGRPTAARFVARKLWEWYAYPAPELALVDELADTFVAAGYEIRELVAAILVHDEFYSAAAATSAAKNPCDFATQAILALGAKSRFEDLPLALDRMGMELFSPPSVNGWTHGEVWLSTAWYRERFLLAQQLASGRDKVRGYRIKPEKLLDRDVATPDALVDRLAARFGLRDLPPAARDALVAYLDGAVAPDDADWVEIKLRGLLMLLFTMPEFQVH